MTDLLVSETAPGEPQRTELELELDSLLVAAAARDRIAFARLYDAIGAAAFGLALRVTGSRSLAEEVVGEAFLEIWQTASAFDESVGTARRWVLSLVRRCALDRVSRLTPTQHQVVALAAFAGCSQAEIAERTGQPIGVVKARMREALTRLHDARLDVETVA